jgi:general secretion pathway protein M
MSERTARGVTPLINRLFAIAILVVLLLVIWTLVVSPIVSSLSDDRQRLSFAEARLKRYTDLIQGQPSMRARLAQLRAVESKQAGFFQGNNTTLLSAEFQQSVQRIITAAGAEVGSSQTVAARQQEGFSRLGLQLTLTTSAAGLYKVLYGLENASPMIVIERLTIAVPESGVSYSTIDGQPGLGISLELAAYANPAASGHGP